MKIFLCFLKKGKKKKNIFSATPKAKMEDDEKRKKNPKGVGWGLGGSRADQIPADPHAPPYP